MQTKVIRFMCGRKVYPIRTSLIRIKVICIGTRSNVDTPIEYIALTTAVPFNTGHSSAVCRSRQLKAALQVFSHYKVPLTFRHSRKRLRKRRSKNLIKFPQVYIAFVLQYARCFEKNNTY